ncbi:MAG: HYR domain-containing protein [Flavobacteriales bacterium]
MRFILSTIFLCFASFSFGQWEQIAQTVYGDQEEGFFGDQVTVSDDGSTVAVAAGGYSGNGLTTNGLVKVYRLIDNQWTQIGQDIFGDANSQYLGNSLSLNEDGTILAIGADSGAGKVFVYAFNNESWSLMGSPLIGNQPGGNFGYCVSISNDGETLAVAREGTNGIYGAHIFEFDGTSWVEVAVGGSPGTVRSVSIDAAGEHVIYGGSSYYHFFDKVNGAWVGGSVPYTIAPSGIGNGGAFLAMSGDGNVYAIGAESNDDIANNTGLVKIYNRADPNALEVYNVYGISSSTYMGRSVSLNHDGTKFTALGNTTWIYEKVDGTYINTANILSLSLNVFMNSEGNVLATGYNDYQNVTNGEFGWLKVFGDLPNTAPVLDCPTSIQVAAADDMCGAMVVLPEILASDLEDGSIVAIQTDGIPSGEFFAIGTHTVTFTATDMGGLSTTCSFDVMVSDETGPQAICASPTIYLDETGFASLTEMDVDGGSIDNCGIVSISLGATSFSCVDLGEQSVEVTFADQQGNTSMCVATVTIADLVLPEIQCTDQTLELNDDGLASIQTGMLVSEFSDNCAASLPTEEYSFTCGDIGTQTIVSTVTDNSGNTASCTSMITVVDLIAPEVNCPSNQMIEIESGTYVLPDYSVSAVAFADDNCGSAELNWIQTPAAETELGVGVHEITLTVNDASGNETTCSFQLEVVLINSIENLKKEASNIYPNPASNIVRIASPLSSTFQVTVLNAFGQVVKSERMNNATPLQIDDLSSGQYMLKIDHGDRFEFTKLIVID